MASERHGASRPETLLRLPEVMARTGLSRSTIYAKISAGTFPRQIPVSKTMVVWRESDICAWIADPH
ncbi:AlpA family phage regulatory protein [Sphingomonas changnyeongensis]|uniref:AlpA family phage regulatory protein n=2 Tax=Sphingomonas changnyeongensis TaxID=2698679 RepID=A0A7Z2S9Q9_9SPHN|nr:AlpA family phage regulatory protein [Sphingomonas changnyeongensis]